MKISPELYNITIGDTTSWSCDSAEKFQKDQSRFKKEGLEFLAPFLAQFDESEKSYRNLLSETGFVVSKDQILALALNTIGFTVKQKIDVDVDITQALMELAEKPIRVVTEEGNGSTYNNKCEVHLPGNTLTMYNEVMIMEDTCSDELQTQLNSGWRIVAACPQPEQRRPDYVLGRYNPDKCVDGSAERP